MRIIYSNSIGEVFRAQISMLLGNRSLQIFLSILGIIITYLSFAGEASAGRSIEYKLINSTISVLIAFSVGGIAGILFLILDLIIKKNTGVVGKHELILSVEGIEEIAETNHSLHKWSGMRGITETGSFYLLWVTERSAHIVPKDESRVDGDVIQFIETSRKRLLKSK